ncbi:MAG TPA: alpha/beta fold hydrolase [Candidatus Deferrimicrobiaceae bacterium]|nr:alpha/beta fold hydrolase [Candidatus Deferrimicrobiaceae bacterium]
MVEALLPIWQRVLQRPSIGIEENFFDIGGNVHSADTLFAEIARECGREVPTATIFQAPTIMALASVLELPSLPRFSAFVPLKAGAEHPPILIAHGLGGRARFSELAKHIRTGHSIYGIQARGIDGREEPFDRIEDMAQFYLEALKELQPEGPYVLIGYSFGGLVALEMAQRLCGEGKHIQLLVLVDAYPHPRHMSARQRLRLGLQRTRRRISQMSQQPLPDAISYFIGGLKHRFGLAPGHDGSPRFPEASRLSLAATTLQVKSKAYVALARYRPRPYRGKIKFLKSESDEYFPGDPVPVWANLAADFEVETVPGTHLDMVTAHFESLAAALTRCLQEAFSQK